MSGEREHPMRRSDALSAALRSLPAERASTGFTAGVLARVDRSDERSRGGLLRPAPVLAALAAAALALAVGLALVPRPERAEPVDGEERVAEVATAAGTVEEPELGIEPPPVPPSADRSVDAASASTEPRSARAAPTSHPLASRPAGESAADARAALARVRAELDALRREHRRFEVGLAELPEIGPGGEPVLFLGGDEGLELVLDLGRDADGTRRGSAGGGGGPTS